MERKLPANVLDWTQRDVLDFLPDCRGRGYFCRPDIDKGLNGKELLLLREKDIMDGFGNAYKRDDFQNYLDLYRIMHKVRQLQIDNMDVIESLGFDPASIISIPPPPSSRRTHRECSGNKHHNCTFSAASSASSHGDHAKGDDGNATRLKPELIKTFIGLLYLFVVTWITAFVMVIVHNRVPDMKKYPPLPDIFLDNVPHIPWAFAMCEFTATLMLFIWVAVLVFHKHRFILLRRFFALSGTVFLLRCVTMLITSLSVPGSHLQCDPMVEELQLSDSVWTKMSHAYTIWSGAGLSIQGVRTCGDYMFSGHTAALTILNFFITEYTPRHLYFMHTFSWVLNMFGIFFILSAHEHYSIDVFIAFYITSRLFLYYHTLANNQALMQRDSTRTRIWFPLFSFFESEIDGIIPNEFDTPTSLVVSLLDGLKKQWAYLYGISMRRPLGPVKHEKNE